MKKQLILILAIFITIGVFAQNRKTVKDLSKLKPISDQVFCDVKDIPQIPFKPGNNIISKAMTSKAIGTSVNLFSVLLSEQNYLDVNSSLNAVMFTYRTGGSWGPLTTSGNTLYSKISLDFGVHWDSILYTPTSTNRFRYPSGVIYNPTGNTNYKQAYSVIAGPNTTGIGWASNFFCSQKLDATGIDQQYFSVAADTNVLTRGSLSSDNGHFHIATPVYVTGGSGYLYHKTDNGVWNSITNTINWSSNFIHPLMKQRMFSDGAGGIVLSNWNANSNIAFGADGLHGYFYTFGADSLNGDPYHTSIPIVWETFDGGTSWVKQPVYMNFHTVCGLRNKIFPTSLSMITYPNNPENWIFRPDFPSGASGNESYFPAVVDAFGYLHIAAIVEGRFSSNPDSLAYSYAQHPRLLFDMIRKDTTWTAIFIDTIRTGVVPSASSGYGTGTDAQGWDHKIHMAKSPDGKKVFVSWTDTDPVIDSTNIMPEPKSWGIDLVTNKMTAPTSFTTGSGNCYYFATARTTLMDNGMYKIPASYINIYESGLNPSSPVKHYYLSGIEFSESAFNISVPVFLNCGTAAVLPTIITTPVSAVANITAVSGGVISNDGGAVVLARGVCWSSSANPVISGNHTSDGVGTGTFISNIIGLNPTTTYHVRAYATNSVGTSYGSDITFTTTASAFTVNGDIIYNNTANTAIGLAAISLMNGATTVASTTSDVTGYYTFSNIPNGTYSVSISTTKSWGGATAVDALKMKRHIAGLELFTEPIRISSADVNMSGTISSTDVLKVLRRVAGLDNSFIRSDWNFEKQTIGGNNLTVNDANVNQIFYALCSGDVNGSFVPFNVMKMPSVSLDISSVLSVNSTETFTLPIRISNATDIGAMQLFLNYPADKVEILGVNLPEQNNELLYSAKNGELRIVWTSLQALSIHENGVLLTLKLGVKNSFENVSFELQKESEFADASGNILKGINLGTSSISNATTSGIEKYNLANTVSIYPNPSKNHVYIDLGKYSTKDVTVSIFNTIGKQIAVINKPDINNLFEYNFSSLSDGLYIIQVNTPEGNVVKKISINK